MSNYDSITLQTGQNDIRFTLLLFISSLTNNVINVSTLILMFTEGVDNKCIYGLETDIKYVVIMLNG